MIYEETYQYLLHNVSSTEFDVVLYSLLNSDWDGVIQAPLFQIAENTGTTKKYLKQIIKKFTSSKRRNVFIPLETEEGTKFSFNLGPTRNLGFNNKTDLYCKKYSFFYEDSFKQLSINAKRLLLMSAFRMSIFKNESVMFEYNEIVPNSLKEGNPFFTRARLLNAIEEIQTSGLRKWVNISFASNLFTHNEMIVFSFKEGTLNEFLTNNTERKLLRKKIFQAGFQEYLNDEFCIEIEKVGKYLYNSLLRIEKQNSKKQGVVIDSKDELLKLSRFIYNLSISKFAKSLNSNKQLLLEPKQASAYFSTIVYDEVLNEMVKYAHQADSIKKLVDNEYFHKEISKKALERDVDFFEVNQHIQPIKDKYKKVIHIHNTLSFWCEEWVKSRVTSVVEDLSETSSISVSEDEVKLVNKKSRWTSPEAALEYLSTLKENVYQKFDELINQINTLGNKAIKKDIRTGLLKMQKDSLSSFFAIQTDRAKFLTELTQG